MNLTPEQQSVFLTLTTEWQTPTQIAGLLQKASGTDINQSLKDLLREGLVQVNPVVLGLYRLTTLGTAIKTIKLDENN